MDDPINEEFPMKYRSMLIAAAVGGFICHLLATWLAPSGIAWYFDPPANIGVSCSPAVGWALSRFRTIQFIAFGVGIPIGILGLMATKSKRGAASPKQNQT